MGLSGTLLYTLSTFKNARFLDRDNIYLANSQVKVVLVFSSKDGLFYIIHKTDLTTFFYFDTLHGYNHQILILQVHNLHVIF